MCNGANVQMFKGLMSIEDMKYKAMKNINCLLSTKCLFIKRGISNSQDMMSNDQQLSNKIQ